MRNFYKQLAFGLIAGEELSNKASDTDRTSLVKDKNPIDFTTELVSFSPESDNEFIGLGYGLGGPLWVKVTTDGTSISDIEVLWNLETPGVGSKAVASLPQAMVEAQSVDVDDFSGATSTSHALKDAVSDALTQAGLL